MEPTGCYAKTQNHNYKAVTREFGHLQQPAVWLFAQKVVHANNKKQIKVPSYWVLVREIDRLPCTPTINIDVLVAIIKRTMTHSNKMSFSQQ